MLYYILNDRMQPQAVEVLEYFAWKDALPADMQTGIGFQILRTECVNGSSVSTVSLGADHGFGSGDPVLWETMTFSGNDEHCERYTSHMQAMIGHWIEVERNGGKA